ncbi:MAG: hypothetical protein ACM3NF_05645 [Gemmatimonadota bacterium]
MWRTIRAVFLGLLVSMVTIFGAGCATSGPLQVKGGLERPAARGPGVGAAGRAVAVADFAYAGLPGGEIGRDFDRARPITWSGSPGKAIPDLIAVVLFEKGVPVIRVADQAAAPPDAAARIWGRVDAIRVDAKRTGTFKIDDAAHVAVTVYGEGGAAPPGWSTAVASDYWSSDALFVTETGVLDALDGAANAVVDEVVARLVSAGIIPPPAAGGVGDRGGR